MKRLSVILLLLGLAGCKYQYPSKIQADEACLEWWKKGDTVTYTRNTTSQGRSRDGDIPKSVTVTEETRWCLLESETKQYLGYEQKLNDKGKELSLEVVKHFHY